MTNKSYESKEIKFCNDGKYRWVYELNMYTTTVLLKECYRAFFITCAIVAVITFFIGLTNGIGNAISLSLTAGAVVTGVFIVLGIIAYFIVAFINGGKYCVVFEMDENGLLHAQQNRQAKKTQLIGLIAAMAGAARGKIGAVGTGILVATKTSMYSGFDSVKVIEAVPNSNLIRLNGKLDRNQVYVDEKDFAFVLQYIVDRCPNAELQGDYEDYLNKTVAYKNSAAQETEKIDKPMEAKTAKSTKKSQDNKAEETPKFCTNCGAPLTGGKFCSGCGAKIE